ncbi:uncharacterized protein BJX67DRAFT_37145 [Aspergillus lucknowensis]|uniref:Nucleolar protein Dnt1-like N-terminal domain-containing protein n=1 Tax=Aspergillus lucknowensis TaxID=176173 RepID=A0ABR4LWF1_9EURO
MVFLRLTVKVYPRDQTRAPNSFSFRSLLGDRERDDTNRNSSAAAPGKPASFLIVLERPEDVTLGGLAGMIKEKWAKLRPAAEPLEIKKLVDDEHESDDLDTDMTVADVFVDNGKARSDGLDQRRVVRVLQRPAKSDDSPVRFPSVAQDWDAAAEQYEIQRRLAFKKEKHEVRLDTIAEESQSRRDSGSRSSLDSWSNYTPNRKHRRDIPVSSVERDDEIPVSPSQPVPNSSNPEPPRDSPGFGLNAANRRLESQELGDSPPSSRGPTPKRKLSTRLETADSQNPLNQASADSAATADSAVESVRESISHSVSPEETFSAKQSRPESISPEGESEARHEASSDESFAGGLHDKDGDVTMVDETAAPRRKPPSAKREAAAAVVITTASSGIAGSHSRKRKNSPEQLSPNKEPRLDRTTPSEGAGGERRNSKPSPGTPKLSPSGRRLDRISSFSGVARRLSFTEQSVEPPKHGLGLGITRSPPKKEPVLLDLSQDSTQSNESLPIGTPIPSFRRESLTQNASTPTNLPTSADKVKNISSALRKETSVERNAKRRSVSFADDDEVLITGSQPTPKSAPQRTVASSTESSRNHSQPASSQPVAKKRQSSGGPIKYPPGTTQELIDQVERKVAERTERQDREKAEFEDKIKTAEEKNLSPDYVRLLKDAYDTCQQLQKLENRNRQSEKKRTERCRTQLETQIAEIQRLESVMEKSSPNAGKKSQLSRKSPKPQKETAATAALQKPSSTTAGASRDKTSPVTKFSGWNAVNNPSTVAKGVKPAAPVANGPGPRSDPKPMARTVATKTIPSPSKASSVQSQNSTASDEVELPAMKVRARPGGAKKSSPENLVEVSSSESEEESDTSSSGSSESESESESESQSEPENAPKGASSPPSAQQNASQAQSQPQPWAWTGTATGTGNTRLSLKAIKGEVASQAAAKAAPKRTVNGPPRKGIFEPPDSDDSEDTESDSESESESDSSSDDSDSSSEGEKESGKGTNSQRHSQSLISGDEGDIMSSGQVRKLKPARMRPTK